MKHNLLLARLDSLNRGVRPAALMLAFSLLSSSCGTLPREVSIAAQANSSTATNVKASRLNLNTAEGSELEQLPGVGKVIADRIIAHRDKYGAFRRAEHLMMVHGISDRKFRALRDLITTE